MSTVLMGLLLSLIAAALAGPDVPEVEALLKRMEERWGGATSMEVYIDRTYLPADPKKLTTVTDENGSKRQLSTDTSQQSRGLNVMTSDGRLVIRMNHPRRDDLKFHGMDEEFYRDGTSATLDRTTREANRDHYSHEYLLNSNFSPYTNHLVFANLLMGWNFQTDDPIGLVNRIRKGTDHAITFETLPDAGECDVLQWTESQGGGVGFRYSIWLRRDRGGAIQRATSRFFAPNRSWTHFEMEVLSMTRVPFTSGGVDRGIWLPERAESKGLNPKGEPDNTQIFEYRDYRIPARIDQNTFTVKFEEGSSVQDVKGKRVWVHGTGPSERLKQMARERVEESKQAIAAAGSQPGRTADRPRDLLSMIGAAAGVLAVAGLSLAAVVLVRRKLGGDASHEMKGHPHGGRNDS